MDAIESDIVDQDYDGLTTREARRRLAKDKYEEAKEAAEIRALTQAAAAKKDAEDAALQSERRKEKRPEEKTPREMFIESELETEIPSEDIKAAVVDFVQVYIEVTTHAAVLLKMQFPENYPQARLRLEVRSKHLDEELVLKLKKAGESEAEKHLGNQQVVRLVERIRFILQRNRLAPAFTDLKQLKSYLDDRPDCSIKAAKEKTGDLLLALKSGRYFLDLDLKLPVGYPDKAVQLIGHVSNLPKELLSAFLASGQEMAKRLAELPTTVEEKSVARRGAGSGATAKSDRLSQSQSLASRNLVSSLAADAEQTQQLAAEKRARLKAEFVSRPSLCPLVELLYEGCLQPLATGKCLICEKQLLPSDPALIPKIPKTMMVLRLYCGHLYHFKCLEEYVGRPPFGKKCLHCGKKMQHGRLMTDEKILEQRWTHEQARRREIEDVTEFMSL